MNMVGRGGESTGMNEWAEGESTREASKRRLVWKEKKRNERNGAVNGPPTESEGKEDWEVTVTFEHYAFL